MVSSSFPLLKTRISTSSISIYFSFPFLCFLILFALRDHKLKLLVTCSFKSNIVFSSQPKDGLFPRRSNGVKNSSYSSSLVAPLQMIPSLIFSNYPFHDLSSFLFLVSQPLADPCNVTHLSIKFIMFNHYLRKTINAIKTWAPFFSWNQYQYSFIGIYILVFWFRSWTLDLIMFPTNQPTWSEFYALNFIFSFKVRWTITHMFLLVLVVLWKIHVDKHLLSKVALQTTNYI